jgi:hypothetical protein
MTEPADVANDIRRAATKPDGGIDIDGLFAALGAASELRIAAHRARQQQLREARNKRRRASYAARKAAGTLPTRSPGPAVERDDIAEPGCQCHTVAMAPCSWCEAGGYYLDGRPVSPGDDDWSPDGP